MTITFVGRSAPSCKSPIDPKIVLAFARAVVRPGGKALFIDERNNGAGWDSLERAVESGRAFTVEVAISWPRLRKRANVCVGHAGQA